MEIILFIITNICLCKILWFCGRLHNGWKFQEPWSNSLGRHLKKFPYFTSKGTWWNCFNFLQRNGILNEAYPPTSFSSAFLISSFVQLSQLAPFSSIVKASQTFKEFHKSTSEKDNCWKNNKRKTRVRIGNDSFHQKDCLLTNALHLPLREVVMVNISFCQEMLWQQT
jgi:hypothetical protein